MLWLDPLCCFLPPVRRPLFFWCRLLPGSLLAHCRLANKPSGDLAEEEIGEPSMEVTLEVSRGGSGSGREGAAAAVAAES